jgi:DNA-binding transcriptional ArsR family regulator
VDYDERMSESTRSFAEDVEQSGTANEPVDALGPIRAMHEFLKALSSPSRQKVMLLFASGGELTVGEVAEKTGLEQSIASEQVVLLQRDGILTSNEQGKVMLNRASRDRVVNALDDLKAYMLACW